MDAIRRSTPLPNQLCKIEDLNVTFEVGFVPTGWRRGLPLRVMRAKSPWPGFVSLDHTKLSMDEKISSDAVGLITFSEEESTNLDPWLDWWNNQQR